MRSRSPRESLALEPVRISEAIRFGEDFELDAESYTLRRGGRALKLERIPMEILLFLVEQKGAGCQPPADCGEDLGRKGLPRYRQQH